MVGPRSPPSDSPPLLLLLHRPRDPPASATESAERVRCATGLGSQGFQGPTTCTRPTPPSLLRPFPPDSPKEIKRKSGLCEPVEPRDTPDSSHHRSRGPLRGEGPLLYVPSPGVGRGVPPWAQRDCPCDFNGDGGALPGHRRGLGRVGPVSSEGPRESTTPPPKGRGHGWPGRSTDTTRSTGDSGRPQTGGDVDANHRPSPPHPSSGSSGPRGTRSPSGRKGRSQVSRR